MIKHVVKGIAELIRHLLNLELFTVNLVLNVINPEVEENTYTITKYLVDLGVVRS